MGSTAPRLFATAFLPHQRRLQILLWLVLFSLLAAVGAFAGVTPSLPLVYVDSSYDPAYDRPADIIVGSGGDLQAAINSAQPGQIIELAAGATFSGNFKFPRKTGTSWIYIRTSQYQQLPPPGTRVGPEHASLMANIDSPNSNPAIFTIFDAHHYRFVGIEISTGAVNTNLVLMGFGLQNPNDPIWMKERADSVDEYPQYITFDRCLIHSTSDANKARTGIAGDGMYIAVVDSYLANFKDTADAQAFKAAQAPGPYKLANNFLEATGENVMFGGEAASVLTGDVLSADIEIRGNHFFKRLGWCDWTVCGGVDNWGVKNLLELKQGIRVLISGNVFEHNWADAQVGTAIVFKPTNQVGNMPWATVEDITFEHNIVRSVASGIRAHGGSTEWPKVAGQTKRILIRNNIFEDVTNDLGSTPKLVEIGPSTHLEPILDIEFSHNLFLFGQGEVGNEGFRIGSIVQGDLAADNLFFENNIIQHGDFGLDIPDLTGTYSFTNNAIVIMPGEQNYGYYSNQSNFDARYGTQNFKADGIASVQFQDYAQGDYRLQSTSPYKNAATDGTDVGPDIDLLEAHVYLYCTYPLEQDVQNQQVGSPMEFVACQKITAGGSTVSSSGQLLLRAGEEIILTEGLEIEAGGTLEISLEPPFPD